MNILDEIAERTKLRITEVKKVYPFTIVRKQAEAIASNERAAKTGTFTDDLLPFEKALTANDISFICEVKKASPSKGIIAEHFPYLEIAKAYEAAGASAISCLTEPYYFMGQDVYLKEITESVSIPVLRKDFTVDEYMIYQAKVLGASAILLICSILDDEQLKSYHELAEGLGLSCLVETHTAEEVNRALHAGARIIGVNNRNLKNFHVNVNRSSTLREMVPKNILFVSESGIKTPADIAALRENGTNAVLIGETLMRAKNKKAMLDYLKGNRPDYDEN